MSEKDLWEAIRTAGAESFPPEKYEKFYANIKALEAELADAKHKISGLDEMYCECKGELADCEAENKRLTASHSKELQDARIFAAKVSKENKRLIDLCRDLFTEDEGLQAITLADIQGCIDDYDARTHTVAQNGGGR